MHSKRFLILCGAFLMLWTSVAGAEQRLILNEPVHLGIAGEPEWEIFAGRSPAGESLRLEFEADASPGEGTLFIHQSDVKQDWTVELNGRRIGSLFLMEADVVQTIPVPAGTLRQGRNELKITARVPEDIVLHRIVLHPEPPGGARSWAHLRVELEDERGAPMPGRVTVLDAKGFLAALHAYSGWEERQAVRPGVAYTGDGTVEVGVLPGDYTVHATRGPEYGLNSATVTVRAGETNRVRLRLAREVPTPGWIAADTHLHTLTLSGHGDATLSERVLTLAGEGVELAVCTEHNRHADYTEAARKAGVDRYFTSVPGNEVTTRRGHFNIFPMATNAPPPDSRIEDWPELMRTIRATPGVRVVGLNHPHDVHAGFLALARTNFHPVTGKNLRGPDFTFNAMELINSGAMRSDWMEPVRSWFAMLNRGLRVTGLGASDSHDVSRFIVGQGRTYIRGDDRNPGAIDVEQACASLVEGRAMVSLGLFAELAVGMAGPGDLVEWVENLAAEVTVLAPDWMEMSEAKLFLNGVEVERAALRPGAAGGLKHARVEWKLPRREHDYFVVMIASGPGVTEPYWGLARPYQPSSRVWEPAVVAITNPIWVDADGDGRFTPARGYAQRLVEEFSGLAELIEALSSHEPVVSAHVAELLEERGTELRSDALRQAWSAGPESVRQGFELYLSAAVP